jgi:hypothetical protein
LLRTYLGAFAMSAGGDRTIRSSSRRKQAFAAWLAFFTLIFGFGWYKSVENARDDLALLQWNKRQAELTKEGGVEWKRLIALIHSLQSKPGSQKALEGELNGGAPFTLRALTAIERAQNEGREVFDWVHPKYDVTYKLYFQDGTLQGSNGHWGGVPESLHPRPLYTARTDAAEWLRQRIARFAGYVYLAAIVGWFTLSKHRLLTAQIALAAALAYGMAWLVNPYYSITWRGVFSNDSLFLGALLLFGAAALLGVTLRTGAERPPLFSEIRFRLSDVLVVVTVAAILLAIGPFGYVTLLAGMAAALVFAAFLYFFRLTAELPS